MLQLIRKLINRLVLCGRYMQSAELSIELHTICAEIKQYISLEVSLCT